MKKEVKTKIVMFLLNSVDNIMKHLGKVDKTFRVHIENVDEWIKQVRREVSPLKGLPNEVSECTDNIQHNYELIYELKDEIEEMKQEINALKLIQIISLKKLKKGKIDIVEERDFVRKRKEEQEKRENESIKYKESVDR